jgi:hypothetical protein
MQKDIFKELLRSWQSPLVARSEVGRFSGGLLNPKTLANMDCLGVGPERVTIGRKVSYKTASLVEWMRARVSQQKGK